MPMIRHDRTPGLRLYMLIFLTAVAVQANEAAVTYRPEVAYKGEAESIGASLAQKGRVGPDGYAVPTAHCGPFYTSVVASIYWLLGVTPKAEFVRIALLIAVKSACCALLPYVGSALGLPRWAGKASIARAGAAPLAGSSRSRLTARRRRSCPGPCETASNSATGSSFAAIWGSSSECPSAKGPASPLRTSKGPGITGTSTLAGARPSPPRSGTRARSCTIVD